jgi:hypothetical protein
MTKAQREEHARQQANQASAQAKTNGLDRNYNFDDTHSINPTDGRPDDGTAITRANNISLGETAYDVVQPSDDSDLEDIICEPYSDEENNPDVDLDMNEVHRNTGRKMRMTGSYRPMKGKHMTKQTRRCQTKKQVKSKTRREITTTLSQPLLVVAEKCPDRLL